MAKQNWKPIPDYEGIYEVSNLGNVRRTSTSSTGTTGQRLKPQILKGRERAYVTLSKNNSKKKVYLATLVGNLFLGECDKGYVWSSKDGNPLNCDVHNLEKVAYQKGSRNPNAKLSDQDKKKILKSKLPVKNLAEKYEVSLATIYRVRQIT